MINFYELFNLTKINFQQICQIFFVSLIASIIIPDFIFDIFNFKKHKKNTQNKSNKFNIIFTIFTIFLSISLLFFLIKTIKNDDKEKFYKIAKMNKLNINYDNFISENKKLYDFCIKINKDKKSLLYKKYNDYFCKIENGDVNSDTINEVFNELYSTINTNEKNKAVEEAIQFIKEDKIQIKVNNKK